MRVDFPHFEVANERAGRAQAAAFYDLLIAPLMKWVRGQS